MLTNNNIIICIYQTKIRDSIICLKIGRSIIINSSIVTITITVISILTIAIIMSVVTITVTIVVTIAITIVVTITLP